MTTDKCPVAAYLPAVTKTKLEALAKHEGRSLSALMLYLADKAIWEAEARGVKLSD